MKLHRSCDVVPDGAGLVCRQTRWGGVALAVLWAAILIGSPTFGWWVGGPWFLVAPLGVLAALLLPLFVGDVRARFRPTNWVVWIRAGGLWIHLRSYQDQSEPDALAVVELGYREIAEVGRRIERYTTPNSSGRSVQHKLKSLDIHLLEPDRGELAAALAENRKRSQPEWGCLGFVRGSSKPAHFSVTLPTPKLLRVAWYGGTNHAVSPSLARVLARLGENVRVAEDVRDDRADWRELNDEELDNRVLELVGRGDRMEAIHLLVRRRGYSHTDAHRFVEELAGRR
jgi:hypothetical protein